MTRHTTRISTCSTLLALACIGAAPIAGAQQAATTTATATATAPAPIQDNSFLVEEAYNQERGVVQHLNTFMRDGHSGNWLYSFTQEWPVLSQAHQLSVTVPVQHAAGASNGFGDAAVSYRLQASGIGGGRVAFAPRLTAMLPTGDAERGFGMGGVGMQVNLPLSVVHGSHLVTHWNAGATWTPAARDPMGGHVSLAAWSAGQSVIWLAMPRLNFLVETAWTRTQSPTGAGATEWNDALLVSPGVRGAIDAAHGVQIVPGIGVPIGVGPSHGTRYVFGYLSFEHAF